jgi:hypothetical protein
MRTASLLLLLLMASLLWAQETPSAPPPPPAAAAEPAPPAPPAEAVAPAAQPAPQLGHPLDPADVATLTGRATTSTPAYTRGYGSYYPPYAGGYPADLPLFGGSQFSGGNWGMPMFSPIGFGRGNLFVFRGAGLAPPLFGWNSPFVGFRPHHGGGHHH